MSLSIRDRRRPFSATVIASAVVGLLAGLAGTLLAAGYLLPTSLPGASYAVVSRETDAQRFPNAVIESAKYSALSFVAKADTGPLPERAYLPNEALGAAATLTTDGWFVALTPDGSFDRGLVFVVGGRAYAVTKSVRDPYSGALFLAVDGGDLPVPSFADEPPTPGESLFAFDAGRAIRTLEVAAVDEPSADSPASLVQSSDRLAQLVRASGPSLPVGTPVFDGRGRVAGLVESAGDGSVQIVPSSAFMSVVDDVVRTWVVSRPVLGARLTDLSRLGGALAPAGLRAGAMLVSYGGTPAVMRGGPAEKAGLRAGDVITAVNDEEVTARRPLAEILADYSSGDTVTLFVRRPTADGQRTIDRSVEVKL